MVTHSGPKVLWISYSHRSSTFYQVLLYSSGQLPMPLNKATILREWDYHCIKRSVSRTIVLDDFCFEGGVVRWYTVEVNFHIWINNLKTKQKINTFSQKKINSWATTSLPMYQNTSFELTEKPSKRKHIWILSYLAFCARFAFGISRLWKLLGRNHLKNTKSKSPLNVLKKNSSLLLITVIFDHSESADYRIHTIFSLSPINTTLAHNDEKAGHDWCVAPNFLWPFYYSHRLTGCLHDRIVRFPDVERSVQSVLHSTKWLFMKQNRECHDWVR